MPSEVLKEKKPSKNGKFIANEKLPHLAHLLLGSNLLDAGGQRRLTTIIFMPFRVAIKMIAIRKGHHEKWLALAVRFGGHLPGVFLHSTEASIDCRVTATFECA